MNLAALIYGASSILRPSLLIPSLIYDDFGALPVDLRAALNACASTRKSPNQKIDIRAVVIDKDNCFAAPHGTDVWPPYKVHPYSRILRRFLTRQQRWNTLREQFPGKRLLIVSNSAGTRDDTKLSEVRKEYLGSIC